MAHRNAPKTYHGWKGKDGKFYISIKPREEKWPKMGFSKAIHCLAVATGRGLPIKWEDPSEID